MDEKKKFWNSLTKERCPRFWIILESGNLLVQWETTSRIMAAPDFQTLEFNCEYGHLQICHPESMQELYEDLQLERVRLIDVRKVKARLIQPDK